jgi:hypothetical protein
VCHCPELYLIRGLQAVSLGAGLETRRRRGRLPHSSLT